MVKRSYGEDVGQTKYRRMGETGDARDIGPTLVESITKVDESEDIPAAIESLADNLSCQLEAYEDQIIKILSDCVAYAPEKMTVFSTLVGLLNAKNNSFGDSLISKLTVDLRDRFHHDEYNIAIRIVTFLADLGNSGVLTLDSIVQFFFIFLDNSNEQNLLSDFYVYCIMHSLPWIGEKIAAGQPDDLREILASVNGYLTRRQKNHLKILGVWEKIELHEQEDYLDNLWSQLKIMGDNNWTENHISRHYSSFASVFADALSHNLPSIQLPKFKADNFGYPMPRVVFRLFGEDECPKDEPAMPGIHNIERFLVEEDLNWIISNNHLNIKLCCNALLGYHKRHTVPLNHAIVEVVFSQLFHLPRSSHLELFYASLLLELCRSLSSSMPQVLAQAAESLYRRSLSMQPICLDRLVNWFSFHLSNFEYRWSWSDWLECVEFPIYDRRNIFVREVLEKCLRFSYHDKLSQFLPEEFEPMIPVKPQIVFVLGDESHPAYSQAQLFRTMIKERPNAKDILLELKADRLAPDDEATFDSDMVAVFIAVLLDVSSKTFSHTFAAFTKHVEVIRKVCKGNRDMQSTVLRTVFDCWGKHKQVMEMLVDKLMKMRIVEPIAVVSWIFCEDMKTEFHRAWVWTTLNIAIFRLDCHATNMEQEFVQLKKQAERKEKFAEETDDDPTEDLEVKKNEVEALQNDVRELLLSVCHNFTVCLTELLVDLKTAIEERSEEVLLQFDYVLGRFKHVFLANPEPMWKYIDDLNRELFSADGIDPKIVAVYEQFRSLKHSS